MTLATAAGICWPGSPQRQEWWSLTICYTGVWPAWRQGWHRSPLEGLPASGSPSAEQEKAQEGLRGVRPHGSEVSEPPQGRRSGEEN